MNKIQNTDLVLPGGLGQVVIGGAVSEIQKVLATIYVLGQRKE